MSIQIDALFRQDANSRLLSTNEPDRETSAPHIFLGRTKDGNLWRFRADLPESLIEKLESLCSDEPVEAEPQKQPRHLQKYIRILETHAPVLKQEMGPAYRFARNFQPSRSAIVITETEAEKLRGGFEDLIDELPLYQPFLAVMSDDKAVSVCRSVRITAAAHEAGVETLPEFRRQGYAAAVVAAWATVVRSMGAIPLYSTSWENTASQAVARKLGLVQYGVDFHIS